MEKVKLKEYSALNIPGVYYLDLEEATYEASLLLNSLGILPKGENLKPSSFESLQKDIEKLGAEKSMKVITVAIPFSLPQYKRLYTTNETI